MVWGRPRVVVYFGVCADEGLESGGGIHQARFAIRFLALSKFDFRLLGLHQILVGRMMDFGGFVACVAFRRGCGPAGPLDHSEMVVYSSRCKL